MFYFCPDCKIAHDEPLEATFGLHVSCADCSLERDLVAARVDFEERFRPAA